MNIPNPQNITIESYNYNLPDERIAKYPLAERDQSKLLVYDSKKITDAAFKNIADFLPTKSLMIFNNTRVIHARLLFRKETGAQIEVFCLEPFQPNDYLLSFQQQEQCSWLCMVGNSKKWKEGILSQQITIGSKNILLEAERIGKQKDANTILFKWDNNSISFADILEAAGELPIPPYLNRKTEESDLNTYQTVYSKIIGSVAAPTAGLHFTSEVLDSIDNHKIKREEVTLHVGAGTFKPVQSSEIGGHEMHSELISVNKKAIEALIEHNAEVVAVGTTSVRTLESLYYLGVILNNDSGEKDLFVPQWMPYKEENNTLTIKESLNNILTYLHETDQNTLIAHTAIIIAPGYDFKLVDAIVTNFHQPKSTLLLLVSAFVGDSYWTDIYNHALENDYRFLSYGDSSLLLRNDKH